MSDIKKSLLASIKKDAFRRGDFTLASGQKSDYYIDCKEVTLTAEGARLVGEAIFAEISGIDDICAVGGMELGSVPISTAVSIVSEQKGKPLANFIVRKEAKGHGTGKKIEGNIGKGSRVVVVEDVVSTGGSSLKAIEAIRESGAEIVRLISLVDREMGGKEAFESAGVDFEPLFTISEVKA